MIALGIKTNVFIVAIAIHPPTLQLDPSLISVINALLVVVIGLALTGLVLLIVASPFAFLPALAAALWGLWEGVELLIREVRHGRRR